MMKKFSKIIACFFAFVLLCFSGAYASSSAEEVSFDTQKNIKEDVCLSEVSEKINRKEEVVVKECLLPAEFEKSNYKYMKVSQTVSYIDSDSNKILSMANIDFNFRYNVLAKEAECLSTKGNAVSYSKDYKIDLTSRCLNETIDEGCGISSAVFNRIYFGKQKQMIDFKNYQVSCDYLGNIDFSDFNS